MKTTQKDIERLARIKEQIDRVRKQKEDIIKEKTLVKK